MKASVSVGGRPKKGDARSTHNWVGDLKLKATDDGDQFFLAAINRAFFGGANLAKGLKRALLAEAKRCEKDHHKAIKRRESLNE